MQVTAALADKQPAISVDTKKKELVGDFRNNGREYCPHGNPEEVRVHDFLIKSLPRRRPGNSVERCPRPSPGQALWGL